MCWMKQKVCLNDKENDKLWRAGSYANKLGRDGNQDEAERIRDLTRALCSAELHSGV